MNKAITIGLDIAKNVFQVHGVDARCVRQCHRQQNADGASSDGDIAGQPFIRSPRHPRHSRMISHTTMSSRSVAPPQDGARRRGVMVAQFSCALTVARTGHLENATTQAPTTGPNGTKKMSSHQRL